MSYKQGFPVRKLKENTLLPPVVPPIFFITLLSFPSMLSKSHLLKTLIVLLHLLTTKRQWSFPGFKLVIEAHLVPLPLVLVGQKSAMSHVAMLRTIF
jgi:hypothetical protein